LHVATEHVGSPVPLTQAARPFFGAPTAAAHTPPPPLQASHWPVQAALQHTPSAQNPVVQSVGLAHAAPCATLQVPANPGRLHEAPAGQLAVPQQTPSTQLPLTHWALDAQASPVAIFCRQVPLLQ
jgi:hypothetical protein